MTRRNTCNSRRFHVEFLEGRNALSAFGAHALAAHAVVHKTHLTVHQQVETISRHDSSPNDSSNDSSNDVSKDSSNGSSKDSSTDPSSRS
jgi:hypothetical protein